LDLQENGNYFEYLGQEIRRIPWVVKRYTEGSKYNYLEFLAMKLCFSMLGRFSKKDCGLSELMNFGCHVYAMKEDISRKNK